MKKFLFVITAIVIFAGCRSYDLTINKVGWSNYSDISVKDFTVLGIITIESQEVFTYGPLGLQKDYRGSRIVWSDLMAEAAKLGAEDVINVRIEETNLNNRKPRIIEFLIGYTTSWKYKATALAVKYTEPVERQKSGRFDDLKGQDS